MTDHLKIAGLLVASCALGGCSADVDQPQAAEGSPTIECALGEGSDFGPDCKLERAEVDGQIIVTVRHPDGGFRRFVQLDDGRGLAELDGADEVSRSVDGSTLEISVGPDRYRFDAEVNANVSANVSGGDDAAE